MKHFSIFLWEGRNMAKLIPLFSGSSGNSYYIGSKDCGILLDIGRSRKQIVDKLADFGISENAVKAIFITHEHIDHVKGLRVFCDKTKVPMFATRGTIKSLEKSGDIDGKFPVYTMDNGIEVAGMKINSFATSHDCAESCGYRVQTDDGKVLALATDLGYISSLVEEGIYGADMLIIESNHDVGMLKNGPYPYQLKKRILSEIGHLSNDTCSEFLPKMIERGTRRFLLAHISSENNTPDIAFQSSLCELTMRGYKEAIDFTLQVAPKVNDSLESIIY